MKKFIMSIMLVIAVAFAGTSVKAQDLYHNNTSHCKLLSDTAGVKMMIVTLAPGEKLTTHTHPWNFGYVLKGGLYKWTYADGTTQSADMKSGDSFSGPPEKAHHSWNAGKTTIQFVLFEKSN